MRTLTAVLFRKGDMYVAECPEAGTVSQGRTVEEAVAGLKEATELYLEEFPKTGEGRSSQRLRWPPAPGRETMIADWGI